MTKQRRKTIPNIEIINKLTKVGLVPESRYGTGLNQRMWSSTYKSSIPLISYKIPVKVYNKVIGKKFNVKFKIGNTVRFRLKSTRYFVRNHYKGSQDIGDIYSWGSLGIGSGKCYDDKEVLKNNRWNNPKNIIALGNNYILNRQAAIKKAKYYTDMGIVSKRSSGAFYSNLLKPWDFYKKIILGAAGILGNKLLINGIITNVFVHFLYPKWEQKREARYEVLFETGARGIFTGDKLDRVFDTDYDIDERFNQCLSKCTVRCCSHKEMHVHDDECDSGCAFGDGLCQPVFDYTKLRDLTVGKGIIIDEEDK